MSESLVQIDTSRVAITVVTLNRPDKRNALSIELGRQVCDAFDAAAKNRTQRAIILNANGPSFCAGLDLKEANDPKLAHESAQTLAKMFLAIATSPLITIAAAQGAAVGGGAGMLAACDFAIGADDLKIGYPEVHRGIVAAIVTTLLRRQLGERVVRELILLGQTVEAVRALDLGLINTIAPTGAETDTAIELAEDSLRGAPGAIARSKRLLDTLAPRTIEQDIRLALDFHLHARESAEAAEGTAAFLEKRKPKWGPRPD